MNEFGMMEMVEMEDDSKDAEQQKSESFPPKTEVKCEETLEEKKPPGMCTQGTYSYKKKTHSLSLVF
jgi:hypothetical protein